MTDPTPTTSAPDLYSKSASRLATLFYSDLTAIGQFESVTADSLPVDARMLLAHNDHMTVTLEAFHKSPVVVAAHHEYRDDASYGRVSTLSRQTDGTVVQFGVIRIWLADLPAVAQEQIVGKQIPLGRVLIEQGVLREVQLIGLFRIMPGPELQKYFGVHAEEAVYGRTAQILVQERPTVQLLEIVRVS
ncbi:MAG: hypothetical protein U0805_04725 [Pirellulales bacterium]